MSLRTDMIELLQGVGYDVLPFGRVQNHAQFLIVRPGGILNSREAIEVWIVNTTATNLYDPDEGLEEMAETLFDLLRRHLVNVQVNPGPVYDPNGKSPHMTMVLTGAGTQSGIGQPT